MIPGAFGQRARLHETGYFAGNFQVVLAFEHSSNPNALRRQHHRDV